jgi:hypothetical protein
LENIEADTDDSDLEDLESEVTDTEKKGPGRPSKIDDVVQNQWKKPIEKKPQPHS